MAWSLNTLKLCFISHPTTKLPCSEEPDFIYSLHLCQKHVIRSTAQGMATLSHLAHAALVCCEARQVIHHRNKQDSLKWLLKRAGLMVVFMEAFAAPPAMWRKEINYEAAAAAAATPPVATVSAAPSCQRPFVLLKSCISSGLTCDE